MTSQLQHKPNDHLECFQNGRWVPCIILKVASYVGKSGPGYYAAYDPPSESCDSFWVNDRMLRQRDPVVGSEA
jgi:hypothetical protein